MTTTDPWQALTAELDLWTAASQTATFWWRDDDAVAASPGLNRLLMIAAENETPICLAVVPAMQEPSLVSAVEQSGADVSIAVHGWRHLNHAAANEKKSEFPPSRASATAVDEAAQGLASIRDAFGPRVLDVFVPPWNRISTPVTSGLTAAGYQGLSTYKARLSATPAPGLRQVNTHADIVDWHNGKKFAGTGTVLGQITSHLAARRDKSMVGDEPTGLLTHHLVHQDDAFDFIARFLRLTARHSAADWPDPRLFFALS